jgi:hypothetical protein
MAILRKNVWVYKRNKKTLIAELSTIIGYYAILVVLVLLTGDSQAYGPNTVLPSTLLSTGNQTTFKPPCDVSKGRSENASTCVVGFSDGPTGCSTLLSAFVLALPLCASPAPGSVHTCACVPQSTFDASASVSALNLVAGAIFSEGSLTNFTMFVPFQLSDSAPAFWPRWSGTSPVAGTWDRSLAVPLLAEIEAGILRTYGGTDTVLEVQKMGTDPWETTSLQALINFPFYMSFLFMNGSPMPPFPLFFSTQINPTPPKTGLQTVVMTVTEERAAKLEQGLFMVGLKPWLYWVSYLTVGLVRNLTSN